MEQDKPFKTIEVIDRHTKQVSKIACMSCIRGHRTTSCGIPVCRSKVFWTVKRPGRPSNACTCQYNSSGGCKCVTAMAKCPHKSRKGEKRTSECRCDEQGRFCCLLESEHWDVLLASSKPIVDFFPTREALESQVSVQSPVAATNTTTPSTPSFLPATPQHNGSCCGTPAARAHIRTPTSIAPVPGFTVASPRATGITPRFDFMGLGAPMGSLDIQSPDVLTWDNDIPIAPREYSAAPNHPLDQSGESSCCQRGPGVDRTHDFSLGNTFDQSSQPPFSQLPDPSSNHIYPEFPVTTAAAPYPAFDFDRWTQDYQNYQFPNAICQSCGLNGCTCRSCPPVMQNFGTTSWAQCCGRKHARVVLPQAPVMPMQLQQQQPMMLPQTVHATAPQTIAPAELTAPAPMVNFESGFDFAATPVSEPLSFGDFIMSDPDRPCHASESEFFGG